MDPELAIQLARKTLVTVFAVASPVLVVVMITGIGVAIVQTVLSLQEQTLSTVPKILAASAVVFAFLPWFLRALADFTIPLLREGLAARL
jgi:flagellar biosynthetic protein FliQ